MYLRLFVYLATVVAFVGYVSALRIKRPGGYDDRKGCNEPLKIGPCEALVPRWFFNKTTSRCEPFQWGGCQPNANNFETLQACKSRCRPLNKPNEGCFDPLKIGPCRGAFPRWYYNKDIMQCELFFWGGCQPNNNNFETLKGCKKQCKPRKQPKAGCFDPQKVGPCKARIPRWYYNQSSRNCELFYWGGCQPNENNFKSLKKCSKKCKPINQPNEVCFDPKKVGPCKALKPRWFYNKNTRQCESFNWGGCQANGNNFETEKECQKTCSVDI